MNGYQAGWPRKGPGSDSRAGPRNPPQGTKREFDSPRYPYHALTYEINKKCLL